jgi:hypothetical protein
VTSILSRLSLPFLLGAFISKGFFVSLLLGQALFLHPESVESVPLADPRCYALYYGRFALVLVNAAPAPAIERASGTRSCLRFGARSCQLPGSFAVKLAVAGALSDARFSVVNRTRCLGRVMLLAIWQGGVAPLL